MLAVLAFNPQTPVTVTTLVDHLWSGTAQSDKSIDTIGTYLRRIRAALNQADRQNRWLHYDRATRSCVLDIDPACVDYHRFIALATRARRDNDSVALQHALALWRGPALADVSGHWADHRRHILHAERLAVHEDLLHHQLAAGQYAAVLRAVTDLVEDTTPTDRLLLLGAQALAAAGHHTAIRGWIARVTQRMHDTVDVTPSTDVLERIDRLITDPTRWLPADHHNSHDNSHDDAADPVPAMSDTAACAAGTTANNAVASADRLTGRLPMPQQLPAPPSLFTGRAAELAHLDQILDVRTPSIRPDAEATVVISAISGAGGIGKTALALHWAYQRLHWFPDGQLYVNLRGFDPSGHPTPAAEAVRSFLVALGVDPSTLPVELDAQAARYRSLVAGQRMLILLDNLLAVCAGLPLAVRIVAARAQHHPTFPLTLQADQLRDTSTRLDGLDAGDLRANLRAVLSWSTRTLSPPAAGLFALLGLAPGPDISQPAAASLAALPESRVGTVLRELEHASLVQQHLPGRYRMHDLIRLHAIEQSSRSGRSGRDGTEAPHRLVGFYLHTAHHGDHMLYPHRPPIDLEPRPPGCVPQPLADVDDVMAWFDAEHPNLLAAQRLATDQGWHREAWQLAWSLSTYHRRRGRVRDDEAVSRAALAAARELGDPYLLAQAHKWLGGVRGRSGAYQDALDHLTQALAYLEETNDIAGQIDTRQALTVVWVTTGQMAQAVVNAEAALELARVSGNQVWEADALNAAGMCHAEVDHVEQAREYCEAALVLQRATGNGEGEAETLDSLGYLEHRGGRYDAALDYYQQALGMFERLDFDYQKADTLQRIGETHAALGRPSDANMAWHQAIRMYETQNRTAAADHLRQQLSYPRLRHAETP